MGIWGQIPALFVIFPVILLLLIVPSIQDSQAFNNPTINMLTGPPGTHIQVKLAQCSEEPGLFFDGVWIRDLTPPGNCVAGGKVPLTTPNGPFEVILQADADIKRWFFQVTTPKITAPSTAESGSEMSVQGTGFTPTRKITFTYPDGSQATSKTDINGIFSTTLFVPQNPSTILITVDWVGRHANYPLYLFTLTIVEPKPDVIPIPPVDLYTDKKTYLSGETVVITVEDFLANTSPTSPDRIDVEIYDISTSTFETISLFEQGTDSGIFVQSFPVPINIPRTGISIDLTYFEPGGGIFTEVVHFIPKVGVNAAQAIALGLDKESYVAGDSIEVTIYDGYSNFFSGTIETVQVEVKDSTTGKTFTLDLFETGKDTGEFYTEIPVGPIEIGSGTTWTVNYHYEIGPIPKIVSNTANLEKGVAPPEPKPPPPDPVCGPNEILVDGFCQPVLVPPQPYKPPPKPEDTVVCPAVCMPMWELTSDFTGAQSCVFNSCGSGCGPDDITTFTYRSYCEAKLPEKPVTTPFTSKDSIAPDLLIPNDITMPATSETGRIVIYNVKAIDDVDEVLTPTCSPRPGSKFAIGSTIVNCRAIDNAGNTATDSFRVTITKLTSTQIPDWIRDVVGWWGDKTVTDFEFFDAIVYLIENKVIKSQKITIDDTAPDPKQGGVTTDLEVPDWLRQSAAWYSQGLTSPDDFANNIEWLIKNGILRSPKILIDGKPPPPRPVIPEPIVDLESYPSSATISPTKGGTLKTDDGSLILEFPPGAVTKSTVISVVKTNFKPESIETDKGKVEYDFPYILEPEGLEFLKPVKIELRMPKQTRITDTEVLTQIPAIFTLNQEAKVEILKNSEIFITPYENEVIVKGEITHFTTIIKVVGEAAEVTLDKGITYMKPNDIFEISVKYWHKKYFSFWGWPDPLSFLDNYSVTGVAPDIETEDFFEMYRRDFGSDRRMGMNPGFIFMNVPTTIFRTDEFKCLNFGVGNVIYTQKYTWSAAEGLKKIPTLPGIVGVGVVKKGVTEGFKEAAKEAAKEAGNVLIKKGIKDLAEYIDGSGKSRLIILGKVVCGLGDGKLDTFRPDPDKKYGKDVYDFGKLEPFIADIDNRYVIYPLPRSFNISLKDESEVLKSVFQSNNPKDWAANSFTVKSTAVKLSGDFFDVVPDEKKTMVGDKFSIASFHAVVCYSAGTNGKVQMSYWVVDKNGKESITETLEINVTCYVPKESSLERHDRLAREKREKAIQAWFEEREKIEFLSENTIPQKNPHVQVVTKNKFNHWEFRVAVHATMDPGTVSFDSKKLGFVIAFDDADHLEKNFISKSKTKEEGVYRWEYRVTAYCLDVGEATYWAEYNGKQEWRVVGCYIDPVLKDKTGTGTPGPGEEDKDKQTSAVCPPETVNDATVEVLEKRGTQVLTVNGDKAELRITYKITNTNPYGPVERGSVSVELTDSLERTKKYKSELAKIDSNQMVMITWKNLPVDKYFLTSFTVKDCGGNTRSIQGGMFSTTTNPAIMRSQGGEVLVGSVADQ